jgi:DNA-directed RNA polymerase subunit RPC12/RpoP
MALFHKCSNCGHEFTIDRTTLLKTGWGRSLSAGFRSASQQLDDYQKVKCPKCGTIEKDERILSYGFLRPKMVIWLVIAAVITMLIVDVLT